MIMKHKTINFIIILIASAFIFSCSETSKLKKQQINYIPNTLSNVYIGMPLKKFEAVRRIENLSVNEGNDLTIAKENYSRDSITFIQYQFDKSKKLYEIIIEYTHEFNTETMYKQKLGKYNGDKEWLFKLNDNLKLKIWIFQNRLCIADSKHF